MFKSSYLNNVYNELINRYPLETEYINAIKEFFSSIDFFIDQDKRIEQYNVIERLIEPERIITFRVAWVDDNGKVNVNRGYRVQHSSLIGPFKGGIRFNKNVNLSIVKFLAFEQTLKNALTTLPLGGAKGGADFDPVGKSDNEIMHFCQSFVSELYRYLGPDLDIPAGDLGVGAKEVGYMYGYYRKIRNEFTGSFTSKGLSYGGSLVRKEATGYGLCYFTNEMLAVMKNTSLENKKVIISGSGNVGLNAAFKAHELGAIVVGMSDSSGYIYDSKGLDLKIIQELKENKESILEYTKVKSAKHSNKPQDLWKLKCDVAFPCATQNELSLEDAKALVANGLMAISEGANKPCTMETTKFFIENGVLFGPSKAANAGGVSLSGLEMSQNSMRRSLTFEELDKKLQTIMKNIFKVIYETANKYGQKDNLLVGANIASFLKLADAMIAQGVI